MRKISEKGGILKATIGFLMLAICLANSGQAQSPDSLMISSASGPPGGSAVVSVFLKNTQFSVSGFTARIVFADSTIAVFSDLERGDDVVDFEHFNWVLSDGTCRIVGLDNLPGGDNPSPLPIGIHELAKIHIDIAENAPWGEMDTIYFASDEFPPDGDNSISDSTGYIFEIPTMVSGMLLLDIFNDVDGSHAVLPLGIELKQNYPNPFNAQTTISFELSERAENTSVKIYDMVGRLVRTFNWRDLPAGLHNTVWNGSDTRDNIVSSGIYFFRLEVDSHPVQTMRMTLLK
ncbi:MAG: FlgD immunoglobulin-like domain containing protein [candidate division Zixibacteria bacterium]